MDTQTKRSGIPVPKSKSINLKKTLSKGDLLSDSIVDVHNQTGELDVFTLLEENIALKEKTETLSSEKNASELRVHIVCVFQTKGRKREREREAFVVVMHLVRTFPTEWNVILV